MSTDDGRLSTAKRRKLTHQVAKGKQPTDYQIIAILKPQKTCLFMLYSGHFRVEMISFSVGIGRKEAKGGQYRTSTKCILDTWYSLLATPLKSTRVLPMDHFHQSLTYGFQNCRIDVLHRIVVGVPARVENAPGLLIGHQVDDIDSRNAT